MLHREQTDTQTVSPTVPLPIPNAAEARVTPEELNAALKALEDHQSSTVAIGSVVDELRLNATPEQIWAEVQQQREQQRMQDAAEKQAKQNPPGAAGLGRYFQPPVLSHLRPGLFSLGVAKPLQTHRRMLRRWRGMRGWVWVLFWCTGGFGLVSGLPHLLHSGIGQVVTIGGDATSETIPVQGKNVIILGDGDKVTLQGRARSVTVLGNKDTLRGDVPASYVSLGDGSDVQWTSDKPHPVAPHPPSP